MWQKPWHHKEGLTIGAGLAVTGAILQYSTGPVSWELLAFPVNIILMLALIASVTVIHLNREKIYFLKWLGGGYSAFASITWTVIVTLVMGLTRQVPGSGGITDMLSNWSFILVYLWLTISLGAATAKSISRFEISRIPFILNHLGLFIAITCAVAGSADMQKYRMTVSEGEAQWQALDEKGTVHELPLAIELEDFRMDEFPPKLLIVGNESGKSLHGNIPLTETDKGEIEGYKVEVLTYMPSAAPIFPKDSSTEMRYNEFHSMGATDAAFVKVTSDTAAVEGWVSSGSFAFPMKALKIDDSVSVVMPEREPKLYVSDVTVYTESGKKLRDSILVNHPCRIDGWKIYQLDYDRNMGRWSEKSVFEIRRDPWMPAVYTGIWMMIMGAVCMILLPERKRRSK